MLAALPMAYGQVVAAAVQQESDLNVRYKKALERFRSGDAQSALTELRNLRDFRPQQPRYLYDYLAVASASGNHGLAVTLAQDINRETAPAYVLEALALSFREQRNFKASLAVSDVAIRRFPERFEPHARRIDALLDIKQVKQAEAELATLRSQHPDRKEVLELGARLSDAQNQPVQVLTEVGKILKDNPKHSFALSMRFHALKKLGAAHLADELTPLSAIPESARLAVQRDQLAYEYRWARINADSTLAPNRWNTVDSVIVKMQKICALNDNPDTASVVAQGGCGDVVEMLSSRRRMDEAIALYEKMLSNHWKISPSAHFAAAEAYSFKREIEKARDIFAATLQVAPGSLGGRIGYAYALLDNGEVDEAYRQADRLQAETKEWINPDIIALREPNDAYTRVQIMSAMIRSYSNRLEEGQQRLEDLAERAPFNVEIKQSLAQTYAMRGWNHRAERELTWLQVLDPSYVPIRLGLYSVRMEIGDVRGAETQLQEAARLLPEEPSVVKAQRNKVLRTMHRLEIDSRYGQSTGSATTTGSAPSGSNELVLDAKLYSYLQDYDWRFFAHTQYASATFLGQNLTRTSLGAGAEYRVRDISLSGEVFNFGNRGIGVGLNGVYQLNDYWSANGALETKSASASVRADATGVTAARYHLGTRYRWHEGRSVGLSGEVMNFSDGNRRHALGASWNEHWLAGPIYSLASTLEYYSSGNSVQDPAISYFNPINDRFVGVSFQNEWLQFSRFNRSIKHILTLGGGNYLQQAFVSGKVFNVHYEQAYQATDFLSYRYGIGHSIHPYDGEQETTNFIIFSASWVF